MNDKMIAVVKIDGVQRRGADTYYFRWEDGGWEEWLFNYLNGFDSETKPLTVSVVMMTDAQVRDLED